MEFTHFVQLIAIGLQARIPMHMTGFPGVGKTEFSKSLEAGFTRAGVKCKVIILVGSIREPQDFGGFPVSTPDGVRLLPMAWARDAKRLAEDGYLVIVFLDELTTVPPTTQAAMLRLLTENVCGELELPGYEPGKGGVVYLCASNAVEWAAGGQEIQAPMANRLWHGEFPMDHETWCDMMVADFPAPSHLPVLPADYLRTHHHRQRALIAAYVRAAGRDAWMAPPDDSARRSGPWPSGRTWYLASRLLAAIEAVSPGNRLLQSAALAGLIGDQALPIDETGKGIYSVKPSTTGAKTWGGVINLKSPDGTDRNYTFRSSYSVGVPNVVVSPTAMNVMYLDIPNPIDVSVPGISPDKIKIRVVNGTFTTERVRRTGGEFFRGNWAVKPTAAGQNVQIIVSATDPGGRSTQYPPYEFRVKRIPKPEARFAGLNGGTISRNTAVAQQGVFALLPDFDFDLQYRITGFSILYTDKLGDFEEVSSGSSLTPRQKDLLGRLTRGKYLTIKDIKAIGPDNRTTDLSAMVFKID